MNNVLKNPRIKLHVDKAEGETEEINYDIKKSLYTKQLSQIN